jgi:hypothetical protein
MYSGANDAASCSGSGSVYVGGLVGGLRQCFSAPLINFNPPPRYYFGFLFKGSGSGGFGAWGYCTLAFYTDPTCTTAAQAPGVSVEGTPPSGGGAWGSGVGSADSSQDTNYLEISCNSPAGSGWYDDLYVTLSSSNGY